PTPGERLGAGVEIGKLVTRGETKHDGARASLNIFFHPIDHFVPRAGNAKHRVGHCLVGPVVILGKKSLSFDDSLFTSGSSGKINRGMNRIRIATGIRCMTADFLPALTIHGRTLDVVEPAVA